VHSPRYNPACFLLSMSSTTSTTHPHRPAISSRQASRQGSNLQTQKVVNLSDLGLLPRKAAERPLNRRRTSLTPVAAIYSLSSWRHFPENTVICFLLLTICLVPRVRQLVASNYPSSLPLGELHCCPAPKTGFQSPDLYSLHPLWFWKTSSSSGS